MKRFRSISLAITVVATAAGFALSQDTNKPPAPPAATPAVPADQTPPVPTAPTRTAKERAKEIKEITASIETVGGTIQLKLEPNKCPLLCANFCNLARKGFWDGREWIDFSRVIRQCGTTFLWYTVPREFDPSLFYGVGGRLVMSKDRDVTEGAKANATRFFITIKNQERWNLDYPAFGNVTSGLQLVVDLKVGDKITKITVAGDVDNLLQTFAPEIAGWDKEFEAAKARGLK